MIPPAVLDSSAVLAFVMNEPGSDRVGEILDGAAVPAPNWAEVLGVAARRGGRPQEVGRTLKALGVWIELVGEDDAEVAAAMAASHPDMSIADRFCLAVGERLESPVYTADRVWADAETAAKVVLIR